MDTFITGLLFAFAALPGFGGIAVSYHCIIRGAREANRQMLGVGMVGMVAFLALTFYVYWIMPFPPTV